MNIKKYLINSFEKVSKICNPANFQKKKRSNSKSNRRLFYFFNKISKSERYQNIFEKFTQFKKKEIKKPISKKRKLSQIKKSTYFINNFSNSKKYKIFFNSITNVKNFSFKQSRFKLLNKLSNNYLKINISKENTIKLFNKFGKLFWVNSLKKDNLSNNKFNQRIGIIFYSDQLKKESL